MRKTIFASVFSFVLALAGCSVDSDLGGVPTGPTPDVSPAVQALFEATIDLSGGTLSGDTAEYVVPAGAVTTATRFSLETSVEGGAHVAECGPSGVQFQEDVTLRIDLPSGYDPQEDHEVQWWDEDEEEWVSIGGTVVGDYVEVEIQHFSRYRAVQSS